MTSLFSRAHALALHDNRDVILPKDIILAKSLMGISFSWQYRKGTTKWAYYNRC